MQHEAIYKGNGILEIQDKADELLIGKKIIIDVLETGTEKDDEIVKYLSVINDKYNSALKRLAQ